MLQFDNKKIISLLIFAFFLVLVALVLNTSDYVKFSKNNRFINPNAIVFSADGETDPVINFKNKFGLIYDSLDDPAIWFNKRNPQESLIFGADKHSGLYIYKLDGSLFDKLDLGKLNNVDIRYNVFLENGKKVDIIAVSNKEKNQIELLWIDSLTIEINILPPIKLEFEPYGLCLYQTKGELYAITSDRNKDRIVQIDLNIQNINTPGSVVAQHKLNSLSEGCVVDDTTNKLFLSEEKVGIWEFNFENSILAKKELFAEIDGINLVPDIEGLSILNLKGLSGVEKYLFVSSQGNNSYLIFDINTKQQIGIFRIGNDKIDKTSATDGIDIFFGKLGNKYPAGIFVAQDNDNVPNGQNFKIINLQNIIDRFNLTQNRQEKHLVK